MLQSLRNHIHSELYAPNTRKNTASQNVLSRKPEISLAFGLSPPVPNPPPNTVKFTFTAKIDDPESLAGYNTGVHFHVDKAEHLRVEKGRIGVRLGDEEIILTPDRGEVTIPPWTLHAWWLLPPSTGVDLVNGDGAHTTIVWERTTPGTREKEIFFRNLISILADTPPTQPPSSLQFFTLFSKLDNYPAIDVRSLALLMTSVPVIRMLAGTWWAKYIPSSLPWNPLRSLHIHQAYGKTRGIAWI